MKDLNKKQLQHMQKMLAKVSNVCAEFCTWYNYNVNDGSIGNCDFDVVFTKVRQTECLCDEAYDALIEEERRARL